RSGVDHGVRGAAAAGGEGDGVEGVTGGFDVDPLVDRRHAEVVQGEAVAEGLRDRLHRELVAGRADLVHVAVDGRQRDPEVFRVDDGAGGPDVIGDAVAHLGDARVDVTQVRPDR